MTGLKPAPFPDQFVLAGRWCRLEPLTPDHAPALFEALQPDIEARHRWLPDYAPRDEAELAAWIRRVRRRPDYVFSAVMDTKTDRCVGRQALMRIRPEHASIELGHVLWGEGGARSRVATEAVFLTARHVFETLGYRRFEWKCNALNEASSNAAVRFGFTFEGVFRQDMIVKGESRDTAWYSMLDGEWPALKAAYEAWLSPRNFDRKGQQKTKLGTRRAEPA